MSRTIDEERQICEERGHSFKDATPDGDAIEGRGRLVCRYCGMEVVVSHGAMTVPSNSLDGLGRIIHYPKVRAV